MSNKASLGEAVLHLGADAADLIKDTYGAKSTVEKVLAGVGGGMKLLGAGVLATGAAVSAVGAGVFGMTSKAAANADELLVMASETGVGVEQLQAMRYAADYADVSLDTMTGTYPKLVKAMAAAKDKGSETAEIFKTLGVDAIDPVTGQLRDSNDVWLESIDALSKWPNETERSAMAMSLMGKSANEMNPLFEAGTDALKTYMDQAVETGYVISESDLATADTLSDTMAHIQTVGEGILNNMGTQFAPGILGIVDTVSGYMGDLSKIVGDKGMTTDQKIAAGAELVKTIATDITAGLPELTSTGLSILKTLISGLLSSLPIMMPAVMGLLTSLVDFLVELAPELLVAGVQLIVLLAQGIASAAPTLIPTVIGLLPTLINTLLSQAPTLMTAGIGLILALAQGLLGAIPVLVQQAPVLIKTFLDFLIQSLPQLIVGGLQLVMMLVFGIIENIPLIIGTIPQMIDMLVQEFSSPEFKTKMGEMGKNLVDGLKKGWTDAWTNFKKNIVKNFTDMVDLIKDLLGIHSPSVPFAWMGSMSAQGYENGIFAGFDQIKRRLAGEFETLMSMGQLGSGLAFAGSSSSEVTKYYGPVTYTTAADEHNGIKPRRY